MNDICLRLATILLTVRILQVGATAAEELRITGVKSYPVTDQVVINYTSDTNHSYVLYQGGTVTTITNAIATMQGQTSVSCFTNIFEGARAFYRIATVSLLPSVFFPSISSSVLADTSSALISFGFSQPFTGVLHYQVGGTAVPGVNGDYLPLSGILAVSNATLATLPIQLLPNPQVQNDRALILTLSQPGQGSVPYSVGTNASVELKIVEGDLGLYFGTLVVTNGFQLPPQPVRLALRSSATGVAKAYFDASRSSLLGGPFSLPIQVNGQSIQFNGEATGEFKDTSLGHNVSWKLSIPTATMTTNGTLNGVFDLRILNLTASGQTNQAIGAFVLNSLQ